VTAKKPAPAPANAKAASTNTKNTPQCKPDPKQTAQPSPQETKPIEAPKEVEAKTEADASAKLNQKYLRKKNVNFNKNILYIQIQLNSARVYSRLKEYDKAKSFYEKVIKKEPNVYSLLILK
jgi:tetratricopeptide (TPR) repeat protein